VPTRPSGEIRLENDNAYVSVEECGVLEMQQKRGFEHLVGGFEFGWQHHNEILFV
jgi:hypothetical protein